MATVTRYTALITTVDQTNNVVGFVTKGDAQERRATILTTPVASRWPIEGETWLVRQENGSWYIDQPLVLSTYNTITPGDVVINSPTGVVHIEGGSDGTNTYTIDKTVVGGRRLVGQAHAFIGPSFGPISGSAFYFIGTDGTLNEVGSASVAKSFFWWLIDPSQYAVPGLTTQFLLRTNIASGSSPNTTIALQMNQMIMTHSSGTLSPNFESLVLTGGGIEPSTDQAISIEGPSGELNITPEAYMPLIELTGVTDSISATSLLIQLFVINT